ncbi:MAG: hypothetical protein WCX32_03320, partial [Clostridia bacterium]
NWIYTFKNTTSENINGISTIVLDGIRYTINLTLNGVSTGGSLVEMEILDIGEYIFNRGYLFKSVVTNGFEDITNLELDSIKVTLFGYELKYASNNINNANFNNSEIYSDFSYQFNNNSDISTLTSANLLDILNANGLTKSFTEIETEYVDEQNYTETTTLVTYTYSFNFTTCTITRTTEITITAIITTNGIPDEPSEVFSATGELEDLPIASTNQAPVWADYLGILAEGTLYSISNLGVVTESAYTKGMYITNPGTYVLKIKYSNPTYTNATSVATPQYQLFCFKISASQPEFKILEKHIEGETVTYRTVNSGTYTNQNIYLAWFEPTPFDYDVNITYVAYDYITANLSENIDYSESVFADAQYVIIDGITQKIKIGSALSINGPTIDPLETANANYYITMRYGNAQTSFASYEITIDNNPIDSSFKMLDDANYISSTPISSLFINQPFILGWQEKASGAIITTTYEYTPFVTSAETIGLIAGTKYMNMKLRTGTSSGALSYSNGVYLEDEIETANTSSILNGNGIYKFTITDRAGNFATQYIIFENSDPIILQQPVQDATNPENILADNVKLTWGTHKAIAYTAGFDELDEILQEITGEYYYNIEGSATTYLIMPITSITLAKFGIENVSGITSITEQNHSTDNLSSQDFSEYSDTTIDLTDTLYYSSLSAQISSVFGETAVADAYSVFPDTTSKLKRYIKYYPYENNLSSVFILIKSNGNETLETLYTTIFPDATINEYGILGNSEGVFKVFVDDFIYSYHKKVNPSLSVSNVSNSTHLQFEINLDNSRVVTRAYDDNGIVRTVTSLDNTKDSRIYVNGGTNRSFAFTTWNTLGVYPFELDTLTLEYYPLSYSDDYSENYPYTASPTVTYDLLTLIDEINAYGTAISDTLNIIGSVTGEGKYVITRTYDVLDTDTAGLDEIGLAGDIKTRVYTFFVDRNEIILSGTQIGSSIEMLLGANNTIFKSFKRYISGDENQLVLYTNLLPVNLIAPSNKYSLYNSTNSNFDTNANLYPFFLTATISYIDQTNPKKTVTTTLQSVTADQDSDDTSYLTDILGINPITLNSFTVVGTRYKFTVTFTDFTDSETIDGTSGTFTANKTSFDFYIEIISPTGTMTGDEDREILIGDPENNLSTKTGVNSIMDTSLTYSWVDPSDPYYAKIDLNKVKIYETAVTDNVAIKNLIYGFDIDDITFINTYALTLNQTLVSTLDTDGDSVLNDSDDYYQYSYTISLPAETDRLYEMYIAYEGSEYSYRVGADSSYYESTQIMAIDHTAPVYNLEKVKQQDDFYQANSASLNLEDYAFALTNDFVFNRATETYVTENALYGYAQDTFRIFYRKYDKYEGGIYNEQSIVPTDEDYENSSIQGLRFSTTSALYSEFTNRYNSLSFKNIVTNYGYYEIIECDEAGNYTVYTVLLRPATFNLTITDTETDINSTLTSSETMQNLLPYEIYSINNGDVWYTVTITDISVQNVSPVVNTFVHYNTTNDDAFINDLNSVIADIDGTKATLGARYLVTITNRFGEEFSVTTNIAGSVTLTPIMSSLTYLDITYVKVQIPANTYITNLVSIIIKKVNGPNLETVMTTDNSATPVTIGTVGLDIIREYFFYAGKYIVTVTDNFGRTNELAYDVSFDTTISPNTPITFDGNYVQKTESGYVNTYYTAFGTEFTYQTISYSLKVSKNGIVIYNDNAGETAVNILASNGITKSIISTIGLSTLTFSTPTTNVNDQYVITLTDYVGNTKNYKIVLYTILPQIILTDIYNNDMSATLVKNGGLTAGSTSKQVVVSWSTISSGIFDAVATYRYADTATNLDTTSITLSMGTILSTVGYYEITITNTDLANSTTVRFYINSADIATFKVFVNQGTTRLPLIVASTQYNYNSESIDQYFTKYSETGTNNYSIEVNDDKQITKTKLDTITYTTGSSSLSTTVTTVIWQISGSSTLVLNKKIAVTTVSTPTGAGFASNYNNGQSEQLLTLSNVTASDIATVSVFTIAGSVANTSVIVSWKTYNAIPGNFIYLDVRLNDGSSLGYFYDGTLTLTDNGKYSFYFYDLAGNQHTFASGTSTSASVFSLYKLHTVPFSIGVTNNGKTSTSSSPIDNAIYNGTVSVLRLYADKVVGVMSVYVSYNGGESEQVTSVNNQFTFEKAGYYVLTINAKIRTSKTGDVQTGVTTYKFTIIDDSEARLGFEFSPVNNYEIIKVIQGTYNVTDFLKQDYNTDTLTSLYLSLYGGHVGLYKITVAVNYITIRASQEFSFNVWIGGETPVITSNVDFGSNTTKDIVLTINKYMLYTANGNIRLRITGQEDVIINEETAGNASELTEITLTENDSYLIQFLSESGNLLASYRINKVAPLNTTAIVLIIIASIGLLVLIFFFFRLRKRMRIR